MTKTLVLTVQTGFHSNTRPSPNAGWRRIHDLNVREPKLYAYDKATGALIAEVHLPANASGSPLTYMVAGKQYVVIPVGGANVPEELIALALP